MVKIKWLRFSSALKPSQVMSGLKRMEYLPNDIEGFQIRQYRDDSISARYIERIDYDEVLKDPFGSESIIKRVVYNQFDFSISFSGGVLEVVNPPRSLVKFTTRLGEVCDFNVSVEPVLIDLTRLYSSSIFFKNAFTEKTIVVSDLVLAPGVSAKVVARGGSDVGGALREITNNKTFKVSSVAYSSKKPDVRASFSVSSDCTLRVSGRDSGLVIDEAREILFKSFF